MENFILSFRKLKLTKQLLCEIPCVTLIRKTGTGKVLHQKKLFTKI